MKIIKFLKKYQLIFFLIILIILLAFLKIKYGNKENPEIINEKKEEISISVTPSKEIAKEIINDGNADFPLIQKLPYHGENFSILGYIKELTLYVEIKNGSKEEVTKEVEAWIKEINPNIEKHEIVFKD